MFRALILVAVFLTMCAGVSVHAQSLYIKKNNSQADLEAGDAKPKIFITPQATLGKSPYKKSTGIQYKDKLKVAQELQFNKKQVAAYEDWKKSAKKPESIAEMVAYAQAEKAVAQGVMLERRKKLIEYLAKKEKLREAKLAKEEKNTVKASSKKKSSKSSKKKSTKI